jgi:hypothetical protein
MSRRRSAAEQRREVEGWRASGVSAAEYAARRGYAVTSLMRWVKTTGDEGGTESAAPRFVRLELAPSSGAKALVVEVGAARIVVEPGFEPEHLGAVVAALAARGGR